MFVVKYSRVCVGGDEFVFQSPDWSLSVSLGFSLHGWNTHQKSSKNTFCKMGQAGRRIKNRQPGFTKAQFCLTNLTVFWKRNTEDCQREPGTKWTLMNVFENLTLPKKYEGRKFWLVWMELWKVIQQSAVRSACCRSEGEWSKLRVDQDTCKHSHRLVELTKPAISGDPMFSEIGTWVLCS